MTKTRLLRELQGLGLAWCALCGIATTIGAIAGWITWHGRPAP